MVVAPIRVEMDIGKRQFLLASEGRASEADVFLNALSLCTQFRSHINKLLSSKIRVSFHSTTDAMKYQKLLLSFQIYKSLCQQTQNSKGQNQMLGGGHFRKGQAKAGA